jgi:hypothetical protein
METGSFVPGGEGTAEEWYFVVLVTDTDGTTIAKLNQSNFSVQVHARGANGPVDTTNPGYCLDETVVLDIVSEALSTKGVYMLRAQPPNKEGKTPDPAYKFTDTSYVFSVSVTVPRRLFPPVRGRTLVAFGPVLPQFGPQTNVEFFGTSV